LLNGGLTRKEKRKDRGGKRGFRRGGFIKDHNIRLLKDEKEKGRRGLGFEKSLRKHYPEKKSSKREGIRLEP